MQGHGHHIESSNKRALRISAILTGIYFVIELVAGILIGSVAVLSDAFHTFSAVGGVLIAIIASNYASKPATAKRTFGYIRAEIFGAFVNGFFLLGMAVFIMFMGYNRLRNPVELATTPMLLVAAGGIITEVIALSLLFKGQKDNLNIKGAYWHILQTFVGSLIIVVAALVIKFTGFLLIDPILGMVFGVFLILASFGLIKESINVFLEATPKHLDLIKIKEDIDNIPGVLSAHHMHAWNLTSGKTLFSSHILVKDMKKSMEILQKATEILKTKYNIYFSTLQTEDKYTNEQPEEIEIVKRHH